MLSVVSARLQCSTNVSRSLVYVLDVLCPLVGGLFLQYIHFPGLTLVILLVELRIFFAFPLEDVALPGGVAGVFTMNREIQLWNVASDVYYHARLWT